MKVRLILLASLTLLIITACAPEVRILSDKLLQDTSVITDEPCAAPCWRGITPGETKWNDALAILEADDTLTDMEIRSNADTGQIGAAWSAVNGDKCCQMFTQDGESVALIVLSTTPDIKFGEVIEKYGEPEYVIGQSLSATQALASVYYLDVPMMIYVYSEGETGTVNEESPVVGFAYTTPELMQLVVDTSNLYNWSGFGTFSDIIGGDFDLTPSITLTPVN
jgi:hypothetical protein